MLISSFHDEESDQDFDDFGEAPADWKNSKFASEETASWTSSEEGRNIIIDF